MAEKTETDYYKAVYQAVLDALTGKGTYKGPTKQKTTTTTKDLIKLTNAASRTLLEQARKAAGIPGAVSAAEVADFAAMFNNAASKQVEEVTRTVLERITPGTKPEDLTNIVNNYVTTTSPSFLDPESMAADFTWSKVNFKDETTLGGKALLSLQKVRAMVDNNGLVDVSDVEVENAAKNIARGLLTEEEFQATITAKAIRNYPQLSERLKANPGSSVRDLLNPYIKIMATTLEKDPNTIKLDNPYLDKAVRPDGTVGKLPSMSIPDFATFLKNTPDYDNTIQANEDARSAATAFGRAWGFGV